MYENIIAIIASAASTECERAYAAEQMARMTECEAAYVTEQAARR